jgi:hypothetical protein
MLCLVRSLVNQRAGAKTYDRPRFKTVAARPGPFAGTAITPEC